jgi:ribosomal protein L29
MKISDIKKLSTDQLTKDSTLLREEIAQMRQKLALGDVKNVRSIRNKRKDLARMLTVLSEQLTKETK